MLIIAIPKSASTSLMTTMGRLHNMDYEQDTSFKKLPKPEETKKIHKYHSDIRQINDKVVEKITTSNKINKQHIFPSKNNIEKLRGKKKIILIRDPQSVVGAYRRGVRTGESHPVEFAKWYESKNIWIEQAQKSGLLRDLRIFTRRWKQNSRNSLVIEYNQLTGSPKKCINEIENYLNISTTEKEIILDKKRYSEKSNFMQGIIWTKVKHRVKSLLSSLRSLFEK
jgi:hypothetical protein